jgi:hypothetical protein
VKESEDGQTLLRRLVLVHRVADEADVSSCATLLNGPVSDLEGALRRLSAEEIEQWFDLELELAIRSQKNKMTTMKTKYGVTNDGRVLGELVVRTAGILSGDNATHGSGRPACSCASITLLPAS